MFIIYICVVKDIRYIYISNMLYTTYIYNKYVVSILYDICKYKISKIVMNGSYMSD